MANTNHMPIGPAALADLLSIAIEQHECVVIEGPPGIGKSDIVKQAARRICGQQESVVKGHAKYIVDFRAATRDPVDLHGIPAVERQENPDDPHGDPILRTAWTVPEFFPTTADIRSGRFAERGVIFLDELMLAPPSMQGALFGFVLDREVGKYCIPPGWSVIAAGNRQQDKSGAYRLLSALADRVTMVELRSDPEAWINWATRSRLDPRVVSFIKINSKALHDFDPDQSTFPTPRGWARVANKWLAACGKRDAAKVLNDGWLMPAIAGTVGVGACTQFAAFLKTYGSLPTLEEIWKNPANAIVPDNNSARCAIATTLATAVKPEQMDALSVYAGRLPKEFGGMIVHDMKLRDDRARLEETGGYVQLGLSLGNVLAGG